MPLKVTDKAIEMAKKAIEEEGLNNHGLRIAVQGGGCSGLQYTLDFSDAARPGDSVFNVNGLDIYVDMASLQYLKGAEIDYVSGLNGTGFKFNNPNATRTCGCGHSFS
ncbi:MAG TPA: iron-sulfur cluster assembly accessory protein [Oligoflexia bacterium]|nr:iron-sulfur cluster assembly accessory protein [Oligoflexia bacterium]HMP47233.1 iron-sulfur cluster assembly accessory protein [Oligoflexia bacterium]